MSEVFEFGGVAFTPEGDGLMLTCPICHGTRFSGDGSAVTASFGPETLHSPSSFIDQLRLTCDTCGWPGKLRDHEVPSS